MLRSLKILGGYKILALDGKVGNVRDFYFDDQSWTVRYMLLDTGNWIPGKQVLISPVALGSPNWETKTFPVNLTSEQIENSPGIEEHQPISITRHQEAEIHKYYGWPVYWGGEYIPVTKPVDYESVASGRHEHKGDPHLRSTAEVIGYHIKSLDSSIGHVVDFITEDETWTIHYMVVDTRNWLPGKKVLISPNWIEEIDWAEEMVHIDLDKEDIRRSPEYDPSAPVNRDYEERLYDYYGRPKYWKEERRKEKKDAEKRMRTH